MNEFQLGLKLQLSGVDSAQTLLNNFSKSLDQQLAGIRDFTKKLGDGNDTVRGYIDSAKEMIEQNPIGETMDKLSGLAESLGLDQISTGISQTAETVRAWTGEITSFMGTAQGASATIKQVLEGDVNGALDSVKTGLASMGNFADLATKMGLPGVATQIDGIATNIGTWVGKVQEFQGATEATAGKLDQAFGGSVHPNVLKVTSGLMEMTGVSKDILPHIDGIQQQFQSLTGKSFPDAFKEMQNLSKEFGKGGMSAKNLAEAFKAPGGAARLMAGGLGIVGAAIAGWKIGKAIGDMDLFGVKINDVAQYSISKAMGAFEKFKGWLHIKSKEEAARAAKAWEDAAEQATMNKPEPKKAEAEGTGGGFDQKKFDQEQLLASQRRLAEGDADRAKAAAENAATKHLDAIDKAFKENTNVYDTTLSERLAAAEKAEQESIKVLEEREAAANNALDVRIQNVNAQMEEINKSGESEEAKATKRNELQNRLRELEADKKAVHEQTEEEKTAITQRYSEKRTEFSKEEAKFLADLQKQEEEKAKATAIAAKKQEDARKKNIQLIHDENKGLEKQIELQREHGDMAAEGSGQQKSRKKRAGLEGKAGRSRGKTDPQTGDAVDAKGPRGKKKDEGKGDDPAEQAEKVLSLGEQIQQTFDDIANSGIESVKESITGLINGTMTWSDALNHIGTTIINTVMNAFTQMITSQISQYFSLDTVKEGMAVREKTRAAGEVAAKSPLALLDSISSWGFAATIGLAALTAAMSSIGGFEGGGYTGDGGHSEVAGLVHRGEMVFDQSAVQAIGKDRLEAIRINRSLPTGMASAGGGGGKALSPNINVQSAQPKVIVVNSQEELMKVMKGSIGEEITVAHIAKNKLRLGMAS